MLRCRLAGDIAKRTVRLLDLSEAMKGTTLIREEVVLENVDAVLNCQVADGSLADGIVLTECFGYRTSLRNRLTGLVDLRSRRRTDMEEGCPYGPRYGTRANQHGPRDDTFAALNGRWYLLHAVRPYQHDLLKLRSRPSMVGQPDLHHRMRFRERGRAVFGNARRQSACNQREPSAPS